MREMIKMILVLTILCTVSGGLLAYVKVVVSPCRTGNKKSNFLSANSTASPKPWSSKPLGRATAAMWD